MEEAKPAMGPPPPPAPPTTKKRPLEDSNAHSNYFKIRAVIRDLRPHFLEVQLFHVPLLFCLFHEMGLPQTTWLSNFYICG